MLTLNILSNFVFHTIYYLLMTAHLLKTPQQVVSLSQTKLFKPGNVIIGGLFPVHKSTAKDSSCTTLFEEGIVLTEAMVYAVKYVNENKLLPYEMTLGYDIRDTCSTVITALKESLDFVNERGAVSSELDSNFTTNSSPAAFRQNPIAVLGAGNSVISSAVNNILSIFKVAQIGYASTSRILSNKNRYPTFLRTVPPDSQQGKAIAKIVSHFGWNYVALFASDNIYGRPLAETFKHEVKKLGVCLALDILIPYNPSVETIRRNIVGKLRQNKNIEVILLFTSEIEAVDILHEAALQNVSHRLWIGSDSWSDSPKIAEDNAKVVEGMFGIINQPTVIPDFMEYFYNLSFLNDDRNFWFTQFWEKIFQCTVFKRNTTFSKETRSVVTEKCTGEEKLSDKYLQTDAVFSRVSYVLDAVLSIVYSVRKICHSNLETQTGTEMSRKEACINSVTPLTILSQIFNITFNSVTKRTVSFDNNGDGVGRYDIINLQSHRKDKFNTSFMKIGEYDGKAGLLKIKRHAIYWPGGVASPPYGRCSVECHPGTFKVVMKPICCWTCKTCPSGSISNVTGASICTQCNPNETPNEHKTKCFSIPTRFLRWNSAWGWVLVVAILTCELTCVITVVIFLRHKETPIVKAANREISFLLLFGLMAGFLVPLAFIGKPTDASCKIQVLLFGASFAFSLSIVLARINRTIVVFRYSKVSPRNQSKFAKKYLSVFLYNRTQIMLALLFTVIELVLCTAWILSSPPQVIARRLTVTERLLMCEMKTNFGHIISNAFIIFLSLLCTLVAFKSRKLPENYNEAKFISFAMFVFNFVWLTFVGVFYGTPDGEHSVIIKCFAILASNLAILALIFGPKLYIILFRPRLNQMAVFRALTAQYSFRPSRKSSAITSDLMASSCILKENKYVQTSEITTEDNLDGKTCNEPNAVANHVKYGSLKTDRTEITAEYTGKRELNDLARYRLGCIREPKTKAVSDTALNRSFDNSYAPVLCRTDRTRAGSITKEEKQSLIWKVNVNRGEVPSCRNSSLNQIKCFSDGKRESENRAVCQVSTRKKQSLQEETERTTFLCNRQLETEV